MAAKYVLEKTRNHEFRFELHAGNGEPILASENYESKQGAEHGIASVQKNSPDEEHYERKTASNGQEYFVLKAGNGQVIGTSEMYSSTHARDHGIESVMKNGSTSEIRDDT